MDQDRDPAETREWLDALDSVEAFEGIDRVDELLSGIVQVARRKVTRSSSRPARAAAARHSVRVGAK